jgi:uroporphyrinogen-III synthase
MPTKENAELVQAMSPASTFIFTSSNAVEALYKLISEHQFMLRHAHDIYATEGKTSERVRQLFPHFRIRVTAQKATELAERIVADKVKQPVFFCGNLRRQELPQLLNEHHINFTELQVYRTALTPVEITGKYDGVVFFSPSAVSSFFEKNELKKGVTCFAIGSTTADALSERTGNKIIVAKQPKQEVMVDAIINFYKGKDHK